MTILCVNANAALDKTLVVNQFSLSAIHRPQDVLVLPGGKGANVARALHTMGADVKLTGWVGGHAGRFIEDRLQQEGIRTAFVHTAQESRECISILDPAGGTMTEIYEKGSPISAHDLGLFYGQFDRLLDSAGLVTLSGSAPPGAPHDFYPTLIRQAAAKAIPVLVDTSGPALCKVFQESQPYLIKPNRTELQDLRPGSYADLREIAGAVRQLTQTTQTHLAVSVGAEGVIYGIGGMVWWASPPAVNAVSAVGSGDCLLAGLALGTIRGLSIEETLCLAIAMGAANTLQMGAGLFGKEDVELLLGKVIVEEI